MGNQNEHLNALNDIRNMMERSSRFVSLNGFAGVFVGVFALAGALAAYIYVGINNDTTPYYDFAKNPSGEINFSFYQFFFTDAVCVLFLSLSVSSILTIRKAKRDGNRIWDNTAKRLLINMMIPLLSGGFFCLIMVYHHMVAMVAPAMLVFYGLALVNSSKYTHESIRYLGIGEIVLGLFAAVFIAHGLLFWAIGFGILHIIYGVLIYFKYEK